MPSYIKKKVKCGCCNNESEITVLRGLYRREAMELDTYPGKEAAFDKIEECPVCGYAGHHISEEANEAIKNYVASGAHRDVGVTDPTERRLLAAARISEVRKDLKNAAYDYLLLSWYRRDTGADGRAAMQQAASLYASYLENHADVDPAITYLDIERQLGNFREAEETADSLDAFVTDGFRKGLIAKEKELIAAGDCGRHSVNEVGR